MTEEELLKLVTPIEKKFWYLKIPVINDNVEGVEITQIEMYIDREGEWQEHYHYSKFTDSDLAVIYNPENMNPDEAMISFYADKLFKAAVEKILTDAGFDTFYIDDLVPNAMAQQEPSRASFKSDKLANFIRETLMYSRV